MLRIGGYNLSLKDTVTWARRRYPNLDIYDESLIPNIIEDHLEFAEGLQVICTVTIREKQEAVLRFRHAHRETSLRDRNSLRAFPSG
ncbi:hypothetical protein H2248_008351 [Termitomyces sp. 'cryptogamus']|nr:hypothetical protein H2248_008351 [Termitomyces sp. 'cryptogamus']